MCLYFKQNYGNVRCDGGTARPLDLGGSSYTGGGLGKYSGGGNSGKKSPEEEELFRQLLESTNIQKEGDSSSLSSLSGGFQWRDSFSRSGRSPLFFIGIIILIILGIILNFIFHLELWLIAVILVIVSVIGFIALAFLD